MVNLYVKRAPYLHLMLNDPDLNTYKKSIEKVNSKISIELPGGITIASIITKASAERMKLKEDKDSIAITKVSNAMIGVGFQSI
jgi:molybdopterin-binding protein